MARDLLYAVVGVHEDDAPLEIVEQDTAVPPRLPERDLSGRSFHGCDGPPVRV
ncbi:MAG: hypothetical protein WCA30_14805 [Dermatophilaceae bacterium]